MEPLPASTSTSTGTERVIGMRLSWLGWLIGDAEIHSNVDKRLELRQ